jgi:glycerol uptake facilitator-like aquaporin
LHSDVLIESLGPVSGAHFNPVVSMVMAYRHVLPRKQLAYYVLAQLMGAAFRCVDSACHV